jgi:sugar phosphate isomerase/epimerase
MVKLAAKVGSKESLVRATSMSPLGDYAPHPDNYKPETEDRLVKSLKEILQTAEDYGVDVVMETHILTTLSTPEVIKRIIDRSESKRLKLNLDPCNFVGDVQTAYNPTPMINHIYDVLGPYIATVHCKDYYMENRLTMHVAETIIGTGMMDFDTILTRLQQIQPNGYAMIEHLPISLVPIAKRNLTQKIKDLGLPLG